MTFQINSRYDYHEICEELNLPFDRFMEFIKENNGSELSKVTQLFAITIREALEIYFENLRIRVKLEKRSKETYKTYKSFLYNFCSFLENNYPSLALDEINEVHLHNYLLQTQSCTDSNTEQAVNSYTVNTYTAILRNFIEFCFKEKWIVYDFRKRFEWAKTSLLPRYVVDEDFNLMLRESVQMINGYRNHAILSVLVGTGLRINELVSLKIKDIDFKMRVIFVRKGKGSKERYVTLYPEVETILLDYLSLTGVKNINDNPDGYVFAKDHGVLGKKPAIEHKLLRTKPITVNAIEKMMQRLCKRVDLKHPYSPHNLRHTFAVRCIKNGMRIEYLSQIMGHRSISTTYIYIQLFPEDLGRIITEKYPFPFQDMLFRTLGVD